MKLSIIIPIYGVEKYIKQCAESFSILYNNPEIEFIFVNDGSRDKSISILEEVISGYSNVKIVHRHNGGLSAARNTGIDNAVGEYIYFADSDDYIDSESFFRLFEKGYTTKSDIIIGDFFNVNETSNLVEHAENYSLGQGVIQGESWPFYLLNHKKISSVVWRCIYRKSTLEKYSLRFHEGVVYEDMEWSPIIFNKVKTIYYSDIKFYYYRNRCNSIINSSLSEKNMYDTLAVSKSLIDYGNQQKLVKNADFFYRTALFFTIKKIYKYDTLKHKNLWFETVLILRKMKNVCSKYRIITLLLFTIPDNLTRKLLEMIFSKREKSLNSL